MAGEKEGKENGSKNHTKKYIVLGITIIILVVISIFFFIVPLPYTATIAYSTQEPYREAYYHLEHVAYKNCDAEERQSDAQYCECTHYSWLGTCDECDCQVASLETNYKTVNKERTETRYATFFQQITNQVNYYIQE